MNLAAEALEQGAMSFSNLFRKATNLFGLSGPDRLRPPPLDGEIVYCKNNVCVHPPANLNKNGDHYPGYLNIRSQDDEVNTSFDCSSMCWLYVCFMKWYRTQRLSLNKKLSAKIFRYFVGFLAYVFSVYYLHDLIINLFQDVHDDRQVWNILYTIYLQVLGSTLILTWIPNSTLQKNPRSIENSPAQARITPRRSPRQEYSKSDFRASCSAGDSPVESPSRGIGSGDAKIRRRSEGAMLSDSMLRNNTKDVPNGRIPAKIGTNVNQLHEKQTNVHRETIATNGSARLEGSETNADMQNTATAVSDQIEESANGQTEDRAYENGNPTAEPQQKLQTSENEKAKILNSKTQQLKNEESSSKRRSSSNRSVASIEMEGDNLVVVTEEIDDEAFMVDADGNGAGDEKFNVVRSRNSNQIEQKNSSSSSDSSHPSLTGNQATKQSQSSTLSQHHHPCGNRDVTRLKETLDLRLNLNTASGLESKISDCNFNIQCGGVSSRTLSSSSTATSGPDTDTPSPVTPPPCDTVAAAGSPSGGSEEYVAILDRIDCGESAESPSFVMTHNMSFPDNSVSFMSDSPGGLTPHRSVADQVCGVFSVDLGKSFSTQSRSIKKVLFFMSFSLFSLQESNHRILAKIFVYFLTCLSLFHTHFLAKFYCCLFLCHIFVRGIALDIAC